MNQGGDFEIVDALYATGTTLFYVVLLVAAAIVTALFVRFLLTATKAAQLYIDRHQPDGPGTENQPRP